MTVAPARVQSVLGASKPIFRDRNEEEVRGYQNALRWIHEDASKIPLDEATLKRLHAMARGQIWDAGQYKEKDGDIIERFADGQERVRFRPTSAQETPAAMGKLIAIWNECREERWADRGAAGARDPDTTEASWAAQTRHTEEW